MKKFGLAVVASLGLLAYLAKAQIGFIDGLDIARACAGDVLRLCAGVIPGDGRVRACVRQNTGNLSPSCHDAIQQEISAPIPQGGAQAKVMRFTGLNNYRHCEVFLIGGNPFDLQGAVYNTTALNNAADPHDSCPADMWSKVDANTRGKQHAFAAPANGNPRDHNGAITWLNRAKLSDADSRITYGSNVRLLPCSDILRVSVLYRDQ